jgi:hypothetical protein
MSWLFGFKNFRDSTMEKCGEFLSCLKTIMIYRPVFNIIEMKSQNIVLAKSRLK